MLGKMIKAFAGFLATSIIALVVAFSDATGVGVTVDPASLNVWMTTLLSGLGTGAAVYFSPKNKG